LLASIRIVNPNVKKIIVDFNVCQHYSLPKKERHAAYLCVLKRRKKIIFNEEVTEACKAYFFVS
jgi:hypothetical protein